MRYISEFTFSFMVTFVLLLFFNDLIFTVLSAPFTFLLNVLEIDVGSEAGIFFQLLFLIGLFAFLYIVIKKIRWFMDRQKFPLFWLNFANLIILLVITHAMAAPYFYTDNYLKAKGNELVHDYYQLFEGGITDAEMAEIAEKTLVMGKRRTIEYDYPTTALQKIEDEDITRKPHHFLYHVVLTEVVDTGNGPKEHTVEYIFTIKWEKYRFLINGIEYVG
ncbi:hypothetical protein [Oceanobacillus salinisoli]|uniref:hypothetical protein n=1 Tax=Oceanobacillus salinisoli TaxID=2678611 RepID=UPI0012E11D06|nr:hypothetical protein [Oceanobacillus salinisoli]